jgi:hypothetical protein
MSTIKNTNAVQTWVIKGVRNVEYSPPNESFVVESSEIKQVIKSQSLGYRKQ